MVFAAEKKVSDITIGITGFNWGVDSYQTTYEQAFKKHCDQRGVKCIVLDPRGSAALQINQVEDLIQKKVDTIIVWPVSGKAILPVLKKAKAAGIPAMSTNSPIDPSGYDLIECHTGPDNIIQGKYGAEMMNEALKGKGKVLEIMGQPGYVTATLRSKGFHDELKKYPGIKIIETQPGNWDREKSQNVMENFLVKYGPGDFDGVYVADDNMGMGAINALKAAGRLKDVAITSACLFGEGYDAINRGELYASVYQSPVDDAKIAVDTAIKLAQGIKVDFYQFFDTPPVTRKNIDQYERPPF
jgi:ribose transport system substrate-binding protein